MSNTFKSIKVWWYRLDDLRWRWQFWKSRDKLMAMADEALEEYAVDRKKVEHRRQSEKWAKWMPVPKTSQQILITGLQQANAREMQWINNLLKNAFQSQKPGNR